jgi:membrane fusion protein (multidrug efflux system)
LFRRHFFLAAAVGFVALLAVLAGAKLLGGAVAGKPAGKAAASGAVAMRAAQVTVALSEPRPFVDRIDAVGVAKARLSVTLTSQTTEIATKIFFHSGDHVKQGQVLAQLKTDEQEAGVVTAEAALAKAKSDYDRWNALGAKGFAPAAQVDLYKSNYLQAKAALDQAKSRLRDRVIRAPFSGVIGLSDAAPGMLITPGTPIATLDDLSSVYVDFDVPERYAGAIGQGTPISATADAFSGKAFDGRISRVDTRVRPDTRSITARAEFANPGERIKPGMLLKVAIARGQRLALAAPEAAVQFESDRPFVFAVASQGGQTIAQQKTVVVGARQGGWIEILAGLSPGERIVADGLNRIQPNQPIKVVAEAEGTAAGTAAP